MDNTTEHDTEEVTHTSKHSPRRKWIIFGGVVGLVILIIAIPLVWLYTGQLNDPKTKAFSKVSLPAAAVGGQLVSMKDVLHRYDIAKEVLGADQAESKKTELYGQILDRLIADTQAQVQAGKLNIKVSDTEVEEQYKKLVEQLTGGDTAQFEAAVKENYKLSLEEFKSEVIRPDILQTKLQTWFNSQRDLNEATYAKADEVQKKISSGEDFGNLAKTYSDDENSKNLQGDAGTILITDMLPEFQSELKDAKAGDVKQISSRYGQHIVKVVDRDVTEGEDKAKLHVQQIFLLQDGYTKWYDEQSAKIKVFRFVKIGE